MRFNRLIPTVSVCSLVGLLYALGGASDCALCHKPIPAGKGVQATVGKSQKKFRCIHCALTGLKGEKRDYLLQAKTPLDGKTVRLTHRNRAWASSPRTTVFLILPERAGECLDVHQPFATRAEFDRYLKANPAVAAQKPKAYTIADYEKMLEAGKG